MAVTERGSRRGVRETDQPGFVDHPYRLDDPLKYQRRKGLAGQRRRLADTIGRSSSLNDPHAADLLRPQIRLYDGVPLRARYQEYLPLAPAAGRSCRLRVSKQASKASAAGPPGHKLLSMALAVPLHRGRTTATVQTSLYDSEQRLVTQTTQIQAVRTPSPPA
jgi:hypothetical protein